MYYLWFDTETGGLESDRHSLLTAFFAICNENLDIIDELYLQLKPADLSELRVDPGAIAVHGIRPEVHIKDPKTITYEEGRKALLDFLSKNKPKDYYRKAYLMGSGHNIDFDKDFLWTQLLSKKDWSTYVSYKDLDTYKVVNFLKDCGIFPADLGKLTSLVDYFNIPKKQAHNAKGDVLMNIEVYRKIKELMQTKKRGMAATIDSNLLEIVEEK